MCHFENIIMTINMEKDSFNMEYKDFYYASHNLQEFIIEQVKT